MSAVTQWFDSEVDPVHVGFYQRCYDDPMLDDVPDFWNGEGWFYGNIYGKTDRAARPNLRWRGLAEKPA